MESHVKKCSAFLKSEPVHFLNAFSAYHPKKTGPTKKELNQAAVKIQKSVRGWLVRQKMQKLSRKVRSIFCIYYLSSGLTKYAFDFCRKLQTAPLCLEH